MPNERRESASLWGVAANLSVAGGWGLRENWDSRSAFVRPLKSASAGSRGIPVREKEGKRQ